MAESIIPIRIALGEKREKEKRNMPRAGKTANR
jgi:hypothetical protein